MGLSLAVGILADLKKADEEGFLHFQAEFAKINEALRTAGLPPYQEPVEIRKDYSGYMYGYSGLHYLRRIAAHLWAGRGLPEPGDDSSGKDPIMRKYYDRLGDPPASFLAGLLGRKRPVAPRFDHLMFHSDAEGFYIPVRFTEVIYPDAKLAIAGGMIGSSPVLKGECEALARALELPLDLDPESEEVWGATESQGKGDTKWKKYGIESFTCLRLWQASRVSVEQGAAIVFT